MKDLGPLDGEGALKEQPVGRVSRFFPVVVAEGVKPLLKVCIGTRWAFQANEHPAEIAAVRSIMEKGDIVPAVGGIKETGQRSRGFREPEVE